MNDEQNVDAGSETTGEQAADTTASEQSDTAATTTDTTAAETAQAEDAAVAENAGGAADETTEVAPDANESRTGFAEPGQKAGDACKCPDGRKGTVHRYDAGLICMPLGDQG